MVVNLDDSSKKGSHWVAIFVKNPNTVLYFDSYGLRPTGKIGEYYKSFKFRKRQRAVIQSLISSVCGYHAIYFVYMASCGFSLETIVKILGAAKNPDLFVVNFVRKNIVQ